MSSQAAGESQLRYQGWQVVAASAAALAFGPSTIAVLSLGLFMRSFEAEFGWSRTQVALATTIVSYMIVFVSPLQGWLIDRYGARRIILWSIPMFGIGVAALSQLPAVLGAYYAAWIILPLLGVGIFPLGYLRAVSSWFRARLGLALGLANSGVAIGSILIPMIVAYLIQSYGWREAYLGLAAIVLLLTLPLAWRYIFERGDTGSATVRAAATVAATGVPFDQAARTRTFVLLSVAFLLIGVTTTAMIVHQVPLLIDAGMSPARAAVVQTVFGIFGLIGRLVTGVLLDRFPATRVMIAFIVGGAAACGLYGFGAATDVAFLCSAMIGLLFGAEFDVLAYMVKQRYGMLAFGRIYGVVFAVFQFGAGFGAALLPYLRDRYQSYANGLLLFAALLVVAAVVFALIRNERSGVEASHAGT